MNIQSFSSIEEVALVDLRESLWLKPLFITISPNPRVIIKVIRLIKDKLKLVPCSYGCARQIEQYDYCVRVVRSTLNYTRKTKLFATWELNKSGNVHLHILLSDPSVTNETQLSIFRRDVLNSELVQDNMINSSIDFMNNIVFVNDSIKKRYDYMTKDMHMNISIMPYFRGLFLEEN